MFACHFNSSCNATNSEVTDAPSTIVTHQLPGRGAGVAEAVRKAAAAAVAAAAAAPVVLAVAVLLAAAVLAAAVLSVVLLAAVCSAMIRSMASQSISSPSESMSGARCTPRGQMQRGAEGQAQALTDPGGEKGKHFSSQVLSFALSPSQKGVPREPHLVERGSRPGLNAALAWSVGAALMIYLTQTQTATAQDLPGAARSPAT